MVEEGFEKFGVGTISIGLGGTGFDSSWQSAFSTNRSSFGYDKEFFLVILDEYL